MDTNETAAYLQRKDKPSGRCAYEKYCDTAGIAADWDRNLSPLEQAAWFYAAVEGWKKITEANTDKRFTT